jgi:hypothetical protein
MLSPKSFMPTDNRVLAAVVANLTGRSAVTQAV